jgi:hypothetical protein
MMLALKSAVTVPCAARGFGGMNVIGGDCHGIGKNMRSQNGIGIENYASDSEAS